MIIMLGVSILTQLKTLFEIKSLLLDKINCINYFIFIKKNNLLYRQKICVFFYFYTFNQLFKNEKLNLINNIYVI